MDKSDWFDFTEPERVEKLDTLLSRLNAPPSLHDKKMLEKQIFQIIDWENKYDER